MALDLEKSANLAKEDQIIFDNLAAVTSAQKDL